MNHLQAQLHFQFLRLADYFRRPETLHMTLIIGVGMLLGVFGTEVYAAGGSMPWEEPICAVAKSLWRCSDKTWMNPDPTCARPPPVLT